VAALVRRGIGATVNWEGMMFRYSSIQDVQFHFATPVLQRMWPDANRYNSALRALVEKKRAESPGVLISNRGGWQSQDDLLTWGGEEIAALTRWFLDCVMQVYACYHQNDFARVAAEFNERLQWRGNAWANVNGRGDWNAMHNHHSSHWSGCYYLSAPPGSGTFSLYDPRPNINMVNLGYEPFDLFRQSPSVVEPKEGLTVVFPSWLQHAVSTHGSDEPRISIALNFLFQKSGRSGNALSETGMR
jgi:uncharacterized protein (TIGR02466 family)